MTLTKQQLRAIHVKSKGYTPIVNIVTKKKDVVVVGRLVDGDTTKLVSPTKREAFFDAKKEAFRRIEKEPRGTLIVASVVKAGQFKKKGVLQSGNFFKNNPIQISVKTNKAKGKGTQETILARREPGKKTVSFNPKLKKNEKGRNFICQVKRRI